MFKSRSRLCHSFLKTDCERYAAACLRQSCLRQMVTYFRYSHACFKAYVDTKTGGRTF